MGSWAIAGRSASRLIRPTWRAATVSASPPKSLSSRIPLSASTPSGIRPNLSLRHSPLSPPSSERFVPRQLSSLMPLHGAIASAKLVSRLPCDTSSSAEGRFGNYLSPI